MQAGDNSSKPCVVVTNEKGTAVQAAKSFYSGQVVLRENFLFKKPSGGRINFNKKEKEFLRKLKDQEEEKTFQEYCFELGNGRAVYPTGCLMNHSCDPNVMRVTNLLYPRLGTAQEFIALRDIQPGDQLENSYIGELHKLLPSHRAQLLKERDPPFECWCPKCEQPEGQEQSTPLKDEIFGYELEAQRTGKIEDTGGMVRCLKNASNQLVKGDFYLCVIGSIFLEVLRGTLLILQIIPQPLRASFLSDFGTLVSLPLLLSAVSFNSLRYHHYPHSIQEAWLSSFKNQILEMPLSSVFTKREIRKITTVITLQLQKLKQSKNT
eukprot:CAMPEP_0174254414 /NCGR_PEP_ID=MMETSP0439-20130205/3736_1 /TAXON_ID=0 /ORGANISM="Stereomyxa ramosa, Strain Chinc5" /LENGTH=321 /DNA_ID=CAMNT_0015335977 /DNA_START=15 /DNA_END=980 /DNA_ORIENTATION=-